MRQQDRKNDEPALTRLGRWAAGLAYRDIPEGARAAARWQTLNMVAATHAASTSAEIASLAPALHASCPPGRSTVLFTGTRHAPADAVLFNAAYSMAQDYDDIIWMGHTCHSAVFAALAVAEHEERTSEEFLTAVVIANELAGRIGASSFFGPLNGQMWTFVHLIGAAAATAKLLRLDAEATTHALAISLAQPNFALQPGFFRHTSKLLAASTPAATGVRAAYFAAHGMTGEANILEDRRGFWKRFSFLPLKGMLEGTGEFWATETLTIKTYPGCHYFQTSIHALEKIIRRRGASLELDEIESIHLETTKLATEVTRFTCDYTGSADEICAVGANFDLALSASILLAAGQLTSREMEPALLREREQDIRRWREKITVSHDPALTIRVIESAAGIGAGKNVLESFELLDLPRLLLDYRREYQSTLMSSSELTSWVRAIARRALGSKKVLPEKSRSSSAVPLYFPGRATVKYRDGRVEREQVDLPPGSFCSPSGEEALREKFERECAPVLGKQRVQQIFRAGLALESMPLSELARSFSAPLAIAANGAKERHAST